MRIEILKKQFITHEHKLIFSLGENDEVECKKTVKVTQDGKLRNFDASLRAISALANNKGGIVLYGVSEIENNQGEKIWEAVGLPNKNFQKLDPANLSMLISETFMPFIDVQPFSFEVSQKFFAGFFVKMSEDKPILTIKNTQDTKEGCIYFRYPGQSKAIKYSELKTIITGREALQLKKLQEIFSTIIGISENENLSNVDRYLKEIPINIASSDSPLSPKVRKDDRANADANHNIVTRGTAVSDEDIVENFIFRREVYEPMSYVSHYCMIAKVYLPIYYYLKLANYSDPTSRVKAIEALDLRKTGHVQKVIDRVHNSGGVRDSTGPDPKYAEILERRESIDFFSDEIDPFKAIRALKRISKLSSPREQVFESLKSAWKYYQNSRDSKFFSELCYATCHVDYLFFN